MAWASLIFAAVFAALFAPVQAQLVFDAERVQLKGQFGQEELHAAYPFENKGKATVTVTEVKSGCGCTVPELEKKVYAPGETGVLRAVFTVGQRQGEQRQTITVQTDQGAHTLRLVVDLPQRLQINPRIMIFSGAQPQPAPAQLTFAEDLPVRIEQIVVSDADFTADYEWIESQGEVSLPSSAPSDGKLPVDGKLPSDGKLSAGGKASPDAFPQLGRMQVRYTGPQDADKRALVQIRSVGKSGKEYVDYLHLRKIR